MTILRRGIDTGLGTRGMFRPNPGDGAVMAHLLLLPGLYAALSAGESIQLREDMGCYESRAAIAAAGSLRRSAAHLLAMHCVNCLARPMRETRPLRATPAFRALQERAIAALREAERLAYMPGEVSR